MSRCGLGAWPGRFRFDSEHKQPRFAVLGLHSSLRSKLPYAPILRASFCAWTRCGNSSGAILPQGALFVQKSFPPLRLEHRQKIPGACLCTGDFWISGRGSERRRPTPGAASAPQSAPRCPADAAGRGCSGAGGCSPGGRGVPQRRGPGSISCWPCCCA